MDVDKMNWEHVFSHCNLMDRVTKYLIGAHKHPRIVYFVGDVNINELLCVNLDQ